MYLLSLPSNRQFARLLSLGLIAILLAGCSSGSAPDTGETESGDVTSSNPMPTAAEGELTVGSLLAQVDAAWPKVSTMRVTTMSGPVPTEGETQTSVAEGVITVEEWSEPNNRRIVELMGDQVVNEQVFVDGMVYMWGVFVGTSVAPEVGPDTWVMLDPALIPPDTPVGYRVSYITREPGTPFGTVSEEMQQRPAKESGTVRVSGRSCTLYTFIDTTQLGERIYYELALDVESLPCQLVQRGGGFQNSSVYEINDEDIQITPPDAATPVTGTPEG
jgi:hypothetical protein